MIYSSRSLKNTSDFSQETSTLTLLLCLFIMLLAFFIVLASHAEYKKDRVTEVLQSVDQAFSGRVFRDSQGPSQLAQPDRGVGEGQELENIAAMFRARIPGAEIRRIPDRGILTVEMSDDDFTKALESSAKSQAATPTQDAGLSVLMSPSKASPLQMEIWMAVDGDPVGMDKKLRDQAIKMASAWSMRLEKEGVAQGRITIGLQQGKAGRVQLLFRPFVPYAPEFAQ